MRELECTSPDVAMTIVATALPESSSIYSYPSKRKDDDYGGCDVVIVKREK